MVSVKSTSGSEGAAAPSQQDAAAASSSTPRRLDAPAGCAERGRVEDAELAAASLAGLMRSMDPQVVRSLVRARELAAGVTKLFPGGDERFAPVDSDSDSGGDDDGEEEGAEPCQGLFDDRMDASAEACLRRACDETGLDLRAEMRDAKMPFLARVRVINFMRALVRDGVATRDVAAQARDAMKDKTSPVWAGEHLLAPVVPGDILLTALEDEESEDEEDDKLAETVKKALE